MDDPDRLRGDDLAAERGELLPDREALSLISADPAQADAYARAFGDLGGTTPGTSATGAAGPGTAAAGDVAQATSSDAAGSGSAETSVTAEHRSEQISRSDTATSQT